MKKTFILALALAFVLSIGATAFAAANPFSDVPAKHWSYDAVSKLAAAKIIEGYGDGTFRGDRTMTRYEMAEVVGKAMAKSDKADAAMKALIDKLAVEFAAELNTLGVRVAKLEKNASSIKFSGDARLSYFKNPVLTPPDTDAGEFQTRLRLNLAAKLNEKADFVGRLATTNVTGDNGSSTGSITYDYAKFIFNNVMPYSNVEIGRSDLFLGQGLIADANGGYDSVRVTFGKELKGFYAYGDISSQLLNSMIFGNGATNVSTLNLTWSPKENLTFTGSALYSHTWKYPAEIWSIGAKASFNNFTFTGEYARNNADPLLLAIRDGKSAWMGSLWYKGADRSKPGTWGAYVDYRAVGNYAIPAGLTTLNGATGFAPILFGFKGFGYGFNYTFAKNAVLTASYEDLSTKHLVREDYDPFIWVRAEMWF